MSIQALSNNNVSFGHTKTTKKGNEYKKTHAATRTGLAVGVAAAGYGAYSVKLAVKQPQSKRAIQNYILQVRESFMQSGMTKNVAGKVAKNLYKGTLGVVLGGIALTGLVLGAVTNKIINHHRASKADKAAQQAQ